MTINEYKQHLNTLLNSYLIPPPNRRINQLFNPSRNTLINPLLNPVLNPDPNPPLSPPLNPLLNHSFNPFRNPILNTSVIFMLIHQLTPIIILHLILIFLFLISDFTPPIYLNIKVLRLLNLFFFSSTAAKGLFLCFYVRQTDRQTCSSNRDRQTNRQIDKLREFWVVRCS